MWWEKNQCYATTLSLSPMTGLNIRKQGLELGSVWGHLVTECETGLQLAGMSDHTAQIVGSGLWTPSRLPFSL